MSSPKIKDIAVSDISELESPNPNVLGQERYELLVKGIKKNGFLQPPLVYQGEDGKYVIVDGVHRVSAARQLGIEMIPVVVTEDRERALMLRLALNKLRGELDMGVVGNDLLDIQEMLQQSDVLDLDDLELTGFSAYETSALMDMVSDVDEDDLLSGAPIVPDAEEIRPKTFNLSVKFESEVERAEAKELLDSHAGDTDAQKLLAALRRAPKKRTKK